MLAMDDGDEDGTDEGGGDEDGGDEDGGDEDCCEKNGDMMIEMGMATTVVIATDENIEKVWR